jgi:hypothetical protein
VLARRAVIPEVLLERMYSQSFHHIKTHYDEVMQRGCKHKADAS